MTVENDKVVSIHYTLKNDDGETIDSSVGSSPLDYVQGRNYLLPKLEEACIGKNPGDKFNVVLEAKDGYGEYNDQLVVDVPRSQFDSSAPIEEGMQFQAMTEAGPQIVTVKKVTDDMITIDGNHDLAGVRLHFDIEIVDVREATADELQSGMVGGSGCGCGGNCGDGGCGGGCEGGCGSGGCGCSGGCGN